MSSLLRECDLGLCTCEPACPIEPDGLIKLAEIPGRMMKSGKRVVQPLRRKVGNQRLEPPEAPAHFVSVPGIAHDIEDLAGLDEREHAPILSRPVNVMGPAVAGPNQSGSDVCWIDDAFPTQPRLEMLRHGRDVLHDQVGPLEHTFVYMLEDVVSDAAGVRKFAQESLVDEARAEAPGLHECAGKVEMGKDGSDHGKHLTAKAQ